MTDTPRNGPEWIVKQGLSGPYMVRQGETTPEQSPTGAASEAPRSVDELPDGERDQHFICD